MVILFFEKQSNEEEGAKGNRDGIGLWSGVSGGGWERRKEVSCSRDTALPLHFAKMD